MTNPKLFFLLLVPILFPGGLEAEQLSPPEGAALEKRFLTAQKQTRTLEAIFHQTVSAPGLREKVSSEGNITYAAPDDLGIAYTNPPGDSLELRGKKFTTVRAGRKPVTRGDDPPSSRALVTLRGILRGIPPAYPMTRTVWRQNGEYVVVLTPVHPSATQPKQIKNVINAQSLQLLSMSITLPRGATIEFNFSQIRRNQSSSHL